MVRDGMLVGVEARLDAKNGFGCSQEANQRYIEATDFPSCILCSRIGPSS